MFRSTFRFPKFILFAASFVCLLVLSACGGGGGGETNSLVNKAVPLSGSKTVIADTVKVEKNGNEVTVNYQTSVPVKKAHIQTV